MITLKENGTINISDLCSNCLHTSDCVFKKIATAPIVFCEEHEAFNLNGSVIKQLVEEPPKPVEEEIKGLCSTCDHRSYCNLRSKDSIILNCELYQ